MQFPNDDVFDQLGPFSGLANRRLRNWYNRGQTEWNIDREFRRALERDIKSAIEGVTNIPLEHIIIDLDRNDT